MKYSYDQFPMVTFLEETYPPIWYGIFDSYTRLSARIECFAKICRRGYDCAYKVVLTIIARYPIGIPFLALLSHEREDVASPVRHKLSRLYNSITLLYNVHVIINYNIVSHHFDLI
ncbi:hypothetical protein KDH_16560 [Dictyobacter sp. S3.2.2.5]|uniref:Uncharacterized protein n=1 Tax=Dictyobacter halimunensis TaxID=3026934 RepID=A0ABQ6FP47_9CHLR|nr:hypothetical protein KDH_16560 [Dictyobacter sp. S3.2.2.5]